jgi:hypothetical protein
VSLFEPETEIIRKGKAATPTEFGKMVKLQEAENQIVTDYEVYEPSRGSRTVSSNASMRAGNKRGVNEDKLSDNAGQP